MSTVPQPRIQPARTGAQLPTLLTTAATSLLNNIGWLRITGEDRTRWLNGMVTNSVQSLQPGQGNYNFLLNAQGRIQGDATIFSTPQALYLEAGATQLPNLTTLLDHFIIMDDVELIDISTIRAGILIAGPHAASRLAAIDLTTQALDLDQLELAQVTWHGSSVDLIHAYSPLVPRFELWSDPATILKLREALAQAGVESADSIAIEQLRVLEGTPLYGIDIRDKELAQETAFNGTQSRALHFNKGCYLGQEIVERIRSRGNVHRTFSTFRLEGALPAPGTLLESEGKQVGEFTTVAPIPLPSGPIQLALGYIRREALEQNQLRNLPLTYPGGAATPIQPFSLSMLLSN